MALTAKDIIFCNEYVSTLNITQSMIKAGYSPKHAHANGYKQLEKIGVKEKIAELMAELAKRNEITADRIVQELAKVAFANTTDFVTVQDIEIEVKKRGSRNPVKQIVRRAIVNLTGDIPLEKQAAIAEIKQTEFGISLKVHDKVRALELLGKHVGIFENDNRQKKTEINVSYDSVDEEPDEV